MKSYLNCALIALYVFLGLSLNTQAADITINVTGKVVASPCIFNNGINNLNINLGSQIQAINLSKASAGSTLVPFNLSLQACPTGIDNVVVTFTGTPDALSPTMYRNTGTATDVAVELSQQGTGKILGNNSTIIQPVEADRGVTYMLNARVFTATGNVMPGNVSAVVQANFTYN